MKIALPKPCSTTSGRVTLPQFALALDNNALVLQQAVPLFNKVLWAVARIMLSKLNMNTSNVTAERQ